MCLVVVALHASPQWPFVLAANRDERHARPASAAAWWRDRPSVLGGRDLEAGGTWLAVDLRGRAAAVTNVRDGSGRQGARSRGDLVTEFVAGAIAAPDYANTASVEGSQFGPFNLLVFDGAELYYASNRAPALPLGPGVHAYSNAPHGTEWPKVVSARARAAALLSSPDPLAGLFSLLAERDDRPPPAERYRHEHFVVGRDYGTRCSTVLVVDSNGHAQFAERSFDADARLIGEVIETFRVERVPAL
jgi:uncharacterized protein with NRDE domain